MRGARWAKGAEVAVFTAAMIGIVVFSNILAIRYPQRWDLTADRRHTLSPQTLQLLSQMKEPVKILAFVNRREGDDFEARRIRDVLENYRQRSAAIDYEMVDPVQNPVLANQYGVTQSNTVAFVKGTKRKLVAPQEVFEQTPEGRTVFRGEQAFTNALLGLLEDKPQVVYFTEGHGELRLDQAGQDGATRLKASLESENRVVKSVNLVQAGRIPSDCAVLFIAGPRRPFAPREVEMVQSYLKQGGKVFLAFELMGDPSLWEEGIQAWGLQAVRHLVVDPKVSPVFALAPTKVFPLYRSHPITDRIAENRFVMMWDTVMWFREEKRRPPGVTVEPLVETSEQSWAEVGQDIKAFKKDPEDDRGPFMIGAAISRAPEKPIEKIEESVKGRAAPVPVMVTVGDADFLSDLEFFNAPGHKDFVLNAISWLLSERARIAIRPQSVELRRIRPLTYADASAVFWTSVIGTPLLVLTVGVVVWRRRRSA